MQRLKRVERLASSRGDITNTSHGSSVLTLKSKELSLEGVRILEAATHLFNDGRAAEPRTLDRAVPNSVRCGQRRQASQITFASRSQPSLGQISYRRTA